MKKEKIPLKSRIINMFTRHTWLKMISLVLAVMTWVYVQGRIQR